MIERIAHITDIHLDEDFPFNDKSSARKRFSKILQDIKEQHINYVVCTGDVSEKRSGVVYFIQELKNIKHYITPGNHDSFLEITRHYQLGVDYSSKKIYRSVENKEYKIIFLDSSSGFIDEKQLVWLRGELIFSKPIIVFIHHPVLGLNLKVDEIGKLKNREGLIEIFTRLSNKVIIFCGHYHMESTSVFKNITQFITPAVAFQIRKNMNEIEIDTSVSGYRIIEIERANISSSVKLLYNAV